MKTLFLLACFLIAVTPIFLITGNASSSDVFECVATEVTATKLTVVCDTEKLHPIVVSREEWGLFSAWHYADGDAMPPVPREWPSVGQVFKAKWVGENFAPIESCAVRLARRRLETQCPTGCCVPARDWVPIDCGSPHSAFVADLLRSLKK